MLQQLSFGPLQLFSQPQQALWMSAVWFAISVLVLDLFDISLPRGDSIGVSGALCASALLLLGPAISTPICLGSALIAHGARRGTEAPHRLATMLLARVAGLSVGSVLVAALRPDGGLTHTYLMAVLVPAAFLLSELVASQGVTAFTTGRPLGRLVRGSLLTQAPLLLAEWSASVLLLITFEGMGSWALVPVVALLLLIRQSYAVLLETRETYRTTVEVLVEAAEGQDPRRAGHAERTAEIARRIGTNMGLTISQVEVISYAALLHDVDTIASDTWEQSASDEGRSSVMFEGVKYFADVLPMLRLCDGIAFRDEELSEQNLTGAMIVALASDADAATDVRVLMAHRIPAVSRVAPFVSAATKARVVSSALSLGYKTPAVG